MTEGSHRRLAGTTHLVRLALRRDRVRIPLWTAGIVGFMLLSTASVVSLYTTPADIQSYVALFSDNPVSIAMSSPGYGFDDPNLGVVLVNETSLWGAVAHALMSVFIVVRHTRTEEETERAELVRAYPVGRDAPEAATLLVVLGANLVIAAATALLAIAYGFPTAGSVALAASFAATGLVFAAVAAVAAQIATTGRGSLGIASAVLGAAFVLRAVGDIGGGTLSWLSPIGWSQAVRPFADERWWVLGLHVVAAAALTALAVALTSLRDLGGGLVAQRLGRGDARRWMTRPLGLAVRLQRGQVIGWSIGMFLLGAVYGGVGRDAEQMIEDNPDLAEFFVLDGAPVTDSFFAVALTMTAMIAAGFAISSALRVRAEETAGRAEPILATPVSRQAWTAANLAVTAAGTVAVVGAAGLGAGAGFAAVTGELGEIPRLTGAALAQLPAVLVLASVGVLLFGILPRLTAAAWGVFSWALLITVLGGTLQLPHLVHHTSPFEHLPALPAEDLRVVPVLVLTGLALALSAAGIAAFRHRDVG